VIDYTFMYNIQINRSPYQLTPKIFLQLGMVSAHTTMFHSGE